VPVKMRVLFHTGAPLSTCTAIPSTTPVAIVVKALGKGDARDVPNLEAQLRSPHA